MNEEPPNFDTNNPFSDQDFGFELVEHPSTPAASTTPIAISSDLDAKLTDILTRLAKIPTTSPTLSVPADLVRKGEVARLEEKIDKVLSMEVRELATSLQTTEGNIRSIIDEVEERKGELAAAHAEAMQQVEKLVLPLMYNLMKNPERDYIKWPNRTEVLNQQIAKVLTITRKPLEF
jgi:hypothetical protein